MVFWNLPCYTRDYVKFYIKYTQVYQEVNKFDTQCLMNDFPRYKAIKIMLCRAWKIRDQLSLKNQVTTLSGKKILKIATTPTQGIHFYAISIFTTDLGTIANSGQQRNRNTSRKKVNPDRKEILV